ncbi:MAG: hypothetical protein IIZ04_02145 [Aeriscardovia sp.]|nr:hypothetical protein [Aeriscardovia sp.]
MPSTMEEFDMTPVMGEVLTERGFSGFTIPYVEAGYFTGGDYFAEVTQYTPSSVICTPRFSAPVGDEDFFKALLNLYRYNSPFNPSFVPFMYSEWYEGLLKRGGLRLKKDGSYVLSISAKSLGGKLYRTFASALYASHTRKDVIIDERKGEYVRG